MSDLFSKYQHIVLNEDNYGSNYETYRGIIFSPKENAFKIVEGKFKDKKDMYEKMVKKGYVLRKCFEKRIFDWIEENSPNNLIAYLMFSTAFSKWRNNNLLSDYYVKLLNDIPAINREGRKGDPQSRGKKNMGGFGEAFLNEVNNLLTEKATDKPSDLKQKAKDYGFKSTKGFENDYNSYGDKHEFVVTLVDKNGNQIESPYSDDENLSDLDFSTSFAVDALKTNAAKSSKRYDDPDFWAKLDSYLYGNNDDRPGWNSGLFNNITYTDPESKKTKILSDKTNEELFSDFVEKYRLQTKLAIYNRKDNTGILTSEEKKDRQKTQEEFNELKNKLDPYDIKTDNDFYIKIEDYGPDGNNINPELVLLRDGNLPSFKQVKSAIDTHLTNPNYVHTVGTNNTKDSEQVIRHKYNKQMADLMRQDQEINAGYDAIQDIQDQNIGNRREKILASSLPQAILDNQYQARLQNYGFLSKEDKNNLDELNELKQDINDIINTNNNIINIKDEIKSKIQISSKGGKKSIDNEEAFTTEIDRIRTLTKHIEDIVDKYKRQSSNKISFDDLVTKADSKPVDVKLDNTGTKVITSDGNTIGKITSECNLVRSETDPNHILGYVFPGEKKIYTFNGNIIGSLEDDGTYFDSTTHTMYKPDAQSSIVAAFNNGKFMGYIDKNNIVNANGKPIKIKYPPIYNALQKNENLNQILDKLNNKLEELKEKNKQIGLEYKKDLEANPDKLAEIKKRIADEYVDNQLANNQYATLTPEQAYHKRNLGYEKTNSADRIKKLEDTLGNQLRALERIDNSGKEFSPDDSALYREIGKTLDRQRYHNFLTANGLDSSEDIMKDLGVSLLRSEDKLRKMADPNTAEGEELKKKCAVYRKLLTMNDQQIMDKYINFDPLPEDKYNEFKNRYDKLSKKGKLQTAEIEKNLRRDQNNRITMANPIHGGDWQRRFYMARDRGIKSGTQLDDWNKKVFQGNGYLNDTQAEQYISLRQLLADPEFIKNTDKETINKLENSLNNFRKIAINQQKYKNSSVLDKLSPESKTKYQELQNALKFYNRERSNLNEIQKDLYEPLIKNKKYVNMSKDEYINQPDEVIEEIKNTKKQYKKLLDTLENKLGIILPTNDPNILLDEKNENSIKNIFIKAFNRLDTNEQRVTKEVDSFRKDLDLDFVNKEVNYDFVKDLTQSLNTLLAVNQDKVEDAVNRWNIANEEFLKKYAIEKYGSLENYQDYLIKVECLSALEKADNKLQQTISTNEKLLQAIDTEESKKLIEINNELDRLTKVHKNLQVMLFNALENSEITDDEKMKIQENLLNRMQGIKDKIKSFSDIMDEYTLENIEKRDNLTNEINTAKGKLSTNKSKKEATYVNQGVNTLDNEEKYGDNIFFEDNMSLNEKLFDTDKKLKSDVKEALLKISETFKKQLDLDIEPVDIYFTGSNANYNYNDQSDIDLHLVFDFEEVGINAEILKKYLKEAKTVFNNQYDIKVKGIPVEVGCENTAEPLVTSGIYSLLNDTWIVQPSNTCPNNASFEQAQYDELTNEIEDAIETHDSSTIGALWKALGALRKDSLANEGEFGKGNLLFKKLRNMDYLKRLKDAYYNSASRELSLEAWDNDLNDTDISSDTKSSEGYMKELSKNKQPKIRDIYNKALKQLSEEDNDNILKQLSEDSDSNVSSVKKERIERIWREYVKNHPDLPIAPEYNPYTKSSDTDEFYSFAELGINSDEIKNKLFPLIGNDGSKSIITILGIDKLYDMIKSKDIPNYNFIKTTSLNDNGEFDINIFKDNIVNALKQKDKKIDPNRIWIDPEYNTPYYKKPLEDVYIYYAYLNPTNINEPLLGKHSIVRAHAFDTKGKPGLISILKNNPGSANVFKGIVYKSNKSLNGAKSQTDALNRAKTNRAKDIEDLGDSIVTYKGHLARIKDLLPKPLWRELYIRQNKNGENLQEIFDDVIYTDEFQNALLTNPKNIIARQQFKNRKKNIKGNEVFDNDGNKIGEISDNEYIKNDQGLIVGYLEDGKITLLNKNESLEEARYGEDEYVISNKVRISDIFKDKDPDIHLPESFRSNEQLMNEFNIFADNQNAPLFMKGNSDVAISDVIGYQLNSLTIDKNTNEIKYFNFKQMVNDKPYPQIKASRATTKYLTPEEFLRELKQPRNKDMLTYGQAARRGQLGYYDNDKYKANVAASNIEILKRGGLPAQIKVASQTGETGTHITYEEKPFDPDEIIMLLNYFEKHYISENANPTDNIEVRGIDIKKYVDNPSKTYCNVKGGKNFLARCYKYILTNYTGDLESQKSTPLANLVQGVLNTLSGIEGKYGPGKGDVRISIKRAAKSNYLTWYLEAKGPEGKIRKVAQVHPQTPQTNFILGNS